MNHTILSTRIHKLTQVIRSARLTQALLRHRVLAGVEHRRVLSTDLSTVVDVGANRGQFALAARKWAPGARVVSFEPLPQAASIFRRVFRNDAQVRLHQAGIGPWAGETTIHVSAADDASSLLPITARQERLFPGTGPVGTAIIRIGRLVDFLSSDAITPPAMLKLDVQGYELKALEGCEELIDRFHCIYVECSYVELYTGQALAHEVIDWLGTRRFDLEGIYNTIHDRDGKRIQADFLFIKSERRTETTIHRRPRSATITATILNESCAF